jgi:hypothetical protein
MRRTLYIAVLMLIAAATDALAGAVTQVPEISPTSVSAGLAVLTGAVLILRSIRR